MSHISARKVVAFAVSWMFGFALGAVTGPAYIFLVLLDRVDAGVWLDWMHLLVERVYISIADEHDSRS